MGVSGWGLMGGCEWVGFDAEGGHSMWVRFHVEGGHSIWVGFDSIRGWSLVYEV
jgi:hypothetical protein